VASAKVKIFRWTKDEYQMARIIEGRKTNLVYTTKLEIDVEVLLIESLESRVD
jgi:hypothetical protein